MTELEAAGFVDVSMVAFGAHDVRPGWARTYGATSGVFPSYSLSEALAIARKERGVSKRKVRYRYECDCNNLPEWHEDEVEHGQFMHVVQSYTCLTCKKGVVLRVEDVPVKPPEERMREALRAITVEQSKHNRACDYADMEGIRDRIQLTLDGVKDLL